MLSILVALGVWQVHRLAWKEALLAEIARAEQSAPVPLTSDVSPFRKVVASGVFRDDLAVRYGADVRDLRQGTVLGAEVIVPMQRASGPPVLVDLGWLPDGQQLDGPAGAITGYVRAGQRSAWFSAPDDVAGRHFYTLDPAAIGAAVGLPDVAPFVLVATGPPRGALIPAEHLPQPPNNHLSYAITWFGLAGALLVIFATWARKAMSA